MAEKDFHSTKTTTTVDDDTPTNNYSRLQAAWAHTEREFEAYCHPSGLISSLHHDNNEDNHDENDDDDDDEDDDEDDVDDDKSDCNYVGDIVTIVAERRQQIQDNSSNSHDDGVTKQPWETRSSGGEEMLLLMPSDSDITLPVSNRTVPTTTTIATTKYYSKVPSPSLSIDNHHGSVNYYDKTNDQNYNDSSNSSSKVLSSAHSSQSFLQKYRAFLRKNQFTFDLIEHVMERYIFYGYLLKHHHHHDHDDASVMGNAIGTEMYYAIWNIIRWINDVVLEGWGDGIGMTIGTREDWFSSGEGREQQQQSISILSETSIFRQLKSTVVPLLRTILTITTCIHPAMEAWTRISCHPRRHRFRRFHDEDDNDLTTKRNDGREIIIRQCRSAQISHRIEKIKFVARLALLSISWWTQYRRRRGRRRFSEKIKDNNKNNNKKNNNNNNKETRRIVYSQLPLLRRGGELDPYEQVIPLPVAEEEAKVIQYVGRRTGRRSIPILSSTTSQSCVSSSPPHIILSNHASSAFITSCLSRLTTSENRILYFYAIGELLHILRPLYWSYEENKQWQQVMFSSKQLLLHRQREATTASPFNYWKAWWISYMMDIISNHLLEFETNDNSTSSRGRVQQHSQHQQRQLVLSAHHARLEELNRRRKRHGLYLLRSPMYDTVTYPLATFIGKIVSVIPSFGLSRWASEYVLEWMSYWNSSRFMLENCNHDVLS